MRVVVQRVREASVRVSDTYCEQIGKGLLLYVGIEKTDTEAELAFVAEKIVNLRIFADKADKMNLSLVDIGGDILSISQFTLTSYIKKGRRPDFSNAMAPEAAEHMYRQFNTMLAKAVCVKTGVFGAMMDIDSINEGPVTFIIEKKRGNNEH